MVQKLTTTDHSRDVAGLKYVYPVISRRAGGLSIGINFNTNNACNWRCIYCQVPDLKRGSAPALDFDLLERELTYFLNDVLHGDFYDSFGVDGDRRVIKDIAISGNGEPTSLKGFDSAVSLIGKVAEKAGIPDKINIVLITNGSLIYQQKVRQGLVDLEKMGGQVWFKLDSATDEGRLKINNAALNQDKLLANLAISAKCCPTWLQTCLFDYKGRGLTEIERKAYLQLLEKIKELEGIKGVLLYTTARPSLQPEAKKITKLSEAVLSGFAKEIEGLGFEVKVSV